MVLVSLPDDRRWSLSRTRSIAGTWKGELTYKLCIILIVRSIHNIQMDDGMTLRYCELWIFSQVLVAVVNILEVFFFGVSSIAGFQMALHTKQITELSLLFTYRFVSFMTVKLYMQQLRDSLERKRRRAYWSGRPQGSQVSSLETWMAQ